MTKILVCGLPGSGKTYLCKKLKDHLSGVHINADEVRKKHNDWDFSPAGRQRQAIRMKTLSEEYSDYKRIVLADFVCPTKRLRGQFEPDMIIWVDTIKEGRFEDTNKIFQPPTQADFHIIKHLDSDEILELSKQILERLE